MTQNESLGCQNNADNKKILLNFVLRLKSSLILLIFYQKSAALLFITPKFQTMKSIWNFAPSVLTFVDNAGNLE